MSVASLNRRFLLSLVACCFSVVLLAPFSNVSAIDRETEPSDLEKDEGERPEAIQDKPNNKEKSATELRKERRDASRKAAADRAKQAVALNKANAAKKKAIEEQAKKDIREERIKEIEKRLGKKEKGYFLIRTSTIRFKPLKVANNAKPIPLPIRDEQLEVAKGRRAAAENILKQLENVERQQRPRGNLFPAPKRKWQLVKRYPVENDANAAKAKGQIKLKAHAKKINEKSLKKAKEAIQKRRGGGGSGLPV